VVGPPHSSAGEGGGGVTAGAAVVVGGRDGASVVQLASMIDSAITTDRRRPEPIVPMAWARAAIRLLPLGELAVVPGSHNANYAAADHLAELFLAFLHSRVLA
jgi:hypothetical protein